MNLIFIAALVAVCGAAKLDRTYLPPASAKTAGGAPGSLQTPFAGNSFTDNNLPKGSFTNDFQGVVVDAANPGTRNSGEGETGLGAPRISYGSTDSRVGDAAFRGTAAGFRPFPGQNFNRQSAPVTQNFDEQTGQNFDGQTQNFDGQNEQNFDGQNQNFAGQSQGVQGSDGQTASSQVQSAAQGFRGQAQFHQANRGPSFESKPERAQAAFDRTASTLRFENEVGPEQYHYAFETDNGISAEENGVATNGVQAQGGFSYTGDDGQVYTITYTADEGGYQPRGDHLPTPPPIPEEILKSLAKNAQDEAAGLVDDGSYDAQRYNAGADYAESDAANVEQNDRQTPKFGKQPEAVATPSGTFINQNNQAFVGQSEQEDGSSEPQDVSSGFGPSTSGNRFGQAAQNSRNPTGAFGSSGSANGFGQSQPGRAPSANDASFPPNNNFGQASQPSRTPSVNGFGSRKEYLPPVTGFNQNRQPQQPSANNGQSSFGFNGISQASASASIGQPQVNQEPLNNQGPQSSPSFGRPSSNRLDVLAQGSTTETPSANEDAESSLNTDNFAQAGQFAQNQNQAQTFGSRNEYLPPTFGQNTRPQMRPQRPQASDATSAPSFNSASQASGSFQQNVKPTSTASAFASASNAQPSQQFNGFGQKRPQSFNNQFTQNRFQSAQAEQNQNEGSDDESDDNKSGQVSNAFGSANQRPTSQPSTELTTPFESNEESQSTSGTAASFGFGAQSPSIRPGSQPESQAIGQSPVTSFRPQNQPINSRPQSSFSSQSQYQAQSSFNADQPTPQTAFEQTESDDAQFAPSSERPSFGQAQGVDQSYYYRQPAKPFNTPSGSRFPGAPSGQFNRVNQQFSAQSSAQFSGASPQRFPVSSFQPQNNNRGSTRYPEPPTLAPATPTDSSDEFQSTISSQYNGITQASISPFQPQRPGSTKYPRPPTLAPTAPTQASQFNNGITQATASSFPSAPSSSFGSRPSFQQNAFNQPQSAAQPNKPFAPQPEAAGVDSSEDGPEVPTQQYNGEIYEYNKPPQGLPATAQKEPSPAPQRGQNFGNNQARPQFASQPSNAQDVNAQQPSRPFGARPQFGTQPSRPQTFDSQGSTSQDKPAQDSRPQFSAPSRPIAQSNQGPSASQTRPKCCQSLDAKIESFRGTAQNNIGAIAPSQSNQFGSQFSGPTSQPGSQSLAGRGEAFGGPRKPPSFDDQTGYHY